MTLTKTSTLTAAALLAALCCSTSGANANPDLVRAYSDVFDQADVEACTALFVEDVSFIDLGNDFSDRIGWFCNAVVENGGAIN